MERKLNPEKKKEVKIKAEFFEISKNLI